MPMNPPDRIRRTAAWWRILAAAVLLVACAPAAPAQLSLGLAVNYVDSGDAGRFGAGAAAYLPVLDHAFDLTAGLEYYHHRWSRLATEPQSDLWVAGLDLHANLPVLLGAVRPYAGTGIAYGSSAGETGFGINLKSGFYLRPTGMAAFPFLQASYRIIGVLQRENRYDSFFLQTGVRFDL
jgi:hypothetical protein